MADQELFTLIKSELTAAIPVMEAILTEWENASEEKAPECMERYTEQIQRIDKVMQMLELDGLQEICVQLETNTMTLADQALPLEVKTLLAQWPQLMIDYLDHPGEADSCQNLIIHFQNSDWPIGLDDDSAYELITQLSAIDSETNVGQPEQRLIYATLDDLKLTLKADIAQELLDSFFIEGPINAIKYLQLVHQLNEDADDFKLIEEAYHRIHTLKGISNTVGVRGIAVIAQYLEEILQYLQQHRLSPRNDLKTYLIEVGDCLDQMFEALTEKQSTPPQTLNILQQTLNWANAAYNHTLSDEGISPIPPVLPQPETTMTAADDSEEEGTSTLIMARISTDSEPEPTPEPEVAILTAANGDDNDDDWAVAEAETDSEVSATAEETLALLQVIQGEFGEIQEILAKTLAAWQAAKTEKQQDEAQEAYAEPIQRVHKTAEMMALTGLETLMQHLEANLMCQQGQTLEAHEWELWQAWPLLLDAYLRQPTAQTIGPLVAHFVHADWPMPLDSEAQTQLEQDLAIAGLAEEEVNPAVAPVVVAQTETEPAAVEEPEATATVEADAILADASEEDGFVMTEDEIDLTEEAIVLPTGNNEMLELLSVIQGEFGEIQEILAKALAAWQAAKTEKQRDEAQEAYAEPIQRVHKTAEMMALTGLETLMQHLEANLMCQQGQTLEAHEWELWQAWPLLLDAYLRQPTAQTIGPLVAHFVHADWPMPLDSEAQAQLEQDLAIAGFDAALEADTRVSWAETTDTFETVEPPLEEPLTAESVEPELTTTPAEHDTGLMVIQAELEDLTAQFTLALNAWRQATSEEAIDAALAHYTEQLQRFNAMTEMVALTGFERLSQHLETNLMLNQGQPFAAETETLWVDWPIWLQAYLTEPTPAHVNRLVEHLTQPQWPMPLEPEEAEQLQQALLTQIPQAVISDSAATNLESEPPAAAVAPLPIADEVLELFQVIKAEFIDIHQDMNKALEVWQAATTEAAIEDAVANYTAPVQRLDKVAEMMNLWPLQTLSQILQHNLQTAPAQPLTSALKTLLTAWPDWLIQYLDQPQQPTSQDALVHCFQQAGWAMPLATGEAKIWREQLANPTQQALQFAWEEPSATVIDASAEVEDARSAEPPVPTLQAILNPLVPLIDSVLQSWFSATNEEVINTCIDRYTEQVIQPLHQLPALENLALQLETNVMTLQGQMLDQHQRYLLAHWITLLQQYATTADPTCIVELLALFQDNTWMIPLDAAEAETWQQQLAQLVADQPRAPITATNIELPAPSSPHEALATSPQEPTTTQTITDTLATATLLPLQQRLIQAKQQLPAILQRWIQAATDEAYTEAIESYTEQIIQPILQTAQRLEFSGIEEICMQLESNAMALHGQPLEPSQQALFADWPELLSQYLDLPADPKTKPALMTHLQSPDWILALDAADAKKLAALLDANLLQAGVAIVSAAPPGIPGDIADSDTQYEATASMTVFAQLQRSIHNIIEPMPILLAHWQQAHNDDEFATAIEQYTQQIIHPLNEAFEGMNLPGFSDICMHIESNAMAMHGQTLTSETHELLERWPRLISQYLEQPDNLALRQRLLAHLQHSGWVIGLDTTEALALTDKINEDMRRFGIQLPIIQASHPVQPTAPATKKESTPAAPALAMPKTVPQPADAAVPAAIRELFAVIKTELVESQGEMATALQTWQVATEDSQRREAVDAYLNQVTRIERVAEMLELGGLQQITQRVALNVEALPREVLANQPYELLTQWPTLVIHYLDNPQDFAVCRALAEHFKQRGWAQALTDEKPLLMQLVDIAAVAGTTGPQRMTEAKPEDVDLSLPDDINPQLLESFLNEGPQHATNYLRCMNQLISGEATMETVNEARRIAHTLKGLANTVGVKGMANLTHQVEDILEYLLEKQTMPTGALSELLLEVADTQEMMFEALSGTGSAPTNTQALLQRVLDCANRIDRGESPNLESAPPTPTKVAETPTVVSDKDKPVVEQVQMIRVAMPIVEKLQRLSEESAIALAQMQERHNDSIRHLKELETQNQVLHHRITELENMVNIQGIAANKRKQKTPDKAALTDAHSRENFAQRFQKIAITDTDDALGSIFDALEMDEYTELHDTVHRVVESVMDNQDLGLKALEDITELEAGLLQQTYRNREIQDMLMDMRMQPVSTIESRLQRSVRQACQTSNKKAVFTISGSEVLLDSQILNDLVDPLMHMLRNAVDHGLESPEDRLAKHKPETGQIHMRLERAGNHILLDVQDDGRGLDLLSIHTTAVEKGLINEEQELTEKDMMRLIMAPGFSTKREVTQLSGRGVGMDVVYTNIVHKLKGSMDINSKPGRGCVFNLRIPLNLSFDQCLLIRATEQTFAIPSSSIERIIFEGAKRIHETPAGWAFEEDIHSYPVRSLNELIHYPQPFKLGQDDDRRSLVLVRAENTLHAIVVDELVTVKELVIKGNGKYLKQVPGIIGASILGNGQVTPILDIADLLRQQTTDTTLLNRLHDIKAPKPTARILVVDDSFSVRDYLSQLLKDAGYQVETARDGLEAVEQIAKALPTALCVDMEMPRMNGLELTEHIRRAGHNIPIMMITSRSTEKHRKQAELAGVDAYITKPYDEGMMMGKLEALIKEHTLH